MAPYRPQCSALIGNTAAASAVEFALLMPIYLLLVLGVLAYGIYFGAAHSVQQLAADAARAAVAGLDPDERAAIVREFVAANGQSYLLLRAGALEREEAVEARTSPYDANQFHVTIRYDATDLPIWNIYPPLPLPGRVIVHRSTIRNGGV